MNRRGFLGGIGSLFAAFVLPQHKMDFSRRALDYQRPRLTYNYIGTDVIAEMIRDIQRHDAMVKFMSGKSDLG